MRVHRFLLAAMAFGLLSPVWAQAPVDLVRSKVLEQLGQQGFTADDIGDLVVRADYVSPASPVRHVHLRQRWQGIEVWNGDIGVHLMPDGTLLRLNNGAWPQLAKRVNTTSPVINAEAALATVLDRNVPGTAMPALITSEDGGRQLTYDGSALGEEPVHVQLMYLAVEDRLRLVWNVNHYTPDGSHWWNVRIDAVNGEELDRNDWVSQCKFDEDACAVHVHNAAPEAAPPPAAPNDLNVYPSPVESPNHGARALRNAPWTFGGGVASPYGWNDTNGANGPEYTTTRGNNCWAQEDANNNNGTGASPTSATLDFDYALNLGGAPNTYQNAAITNLYYWNNLVHDVWYPYGFDDPSGNFQQNNYGRGGTGNDFVYADAQDGGGTNNANFATPPEGTSPRMQMYVWNYTTPNRDGDLDNGVIAHEYGHGISNRLVGNNVNCLTNNEQMGEGWSDWIGLMMTIEPGDQGIDRRGIGTYVIGQGVTGGGIRPAPYSTDFAQNNFTYAATNNTGAIAVPHGIGFVWCTILWEVSWELINTYGFDPNLYTGTGGNNIAMHLIIEGMKLTPCNPGFVDARNAILAADAALYGGSHQTALWNAFARRGLGASASQGSSASRTDQVEAYDTPAPNNIGVSSVTAPAGSATIDCTGGSTLVSATLRNFGSSPQSNFPVRYRLDAGAWVLETYTGTLAAGASANYTFTTPLVIGTTGAHTVTVSTLLAGDSFTGNDQSSSAITVTNGTIVPAPFSEGLAVAVVPAPAGWRLENPDGLTTWTTSTPTGINCASSRVWRIDHYNYNGIGQEDRLVTPRVNLNSMINSQLRFDRAFAPYGPGYYDAFRVDISNNCGASWTQLYYASGVALATTAANTNAWAPTNCSQWQTNTINISAYDGQTVQIRFVAINAWGNFFYMDNVQVFGTSTLPVELLGLEAWPNSRGILLTWTTATELNSERFDIERSTDGENWTRIGTEAAQGNTHTLTEYAFLDATPQPGLNYYRLHMIDLDGSSERSSIVSAEWKAGAPLCHPNPNDGSFWVSITAGTPLEIIDALGQSVPYTRVDQGEGSARIELLRPVTGLYLLRIGSGEDAVVERVMLSAR